MHGIAIRAAALDRGGRWPTALAAAMLLAFTQAAWTAPHTLDDGALAGLTAGAAAPGRGVVIGNESDGNARQTLELGIDGFAQQRAAAANLVNANDSANANAINIWDGRTADAAAPDRQALPGFEVNQVNDVIQAQPGDARLSGYARAGGDRREQRLRDGRQLQRQDLADVHQTRSFVDEASVTASSAEASIDTRTRFDIGDRFFFEGNLGQGLAAAGNAAITLDGGSADIALNVGGDITVGADSANVTGGIQVGDIDFGETGFAAGIDVETRITLLAQLQLPAMTVSVSGAGCGVVLGSCSAHSSSVETTRRVSENSSLDLVEEHRVGSSDYSDHWLLETRSAFSIGDARATYIVVDDSSLELDVESRLELGDRAQQEARALNIVNALGSNAANTINLARALDFAGRGSALVLNQFNRVRHGN